MENNISIYDFEISFMYEGKEYMTIGRDRENRQIECQTVPFDDKYYWFQVEKDFTCGKNAKVRLLDIPEPE